MLRISTLGVLVLFSFFLGQSQSLIVASRWGVVRLKVANENSLDTYPEAYKIKKIMVTNKSKINHWQKVEDVRSAF